VSAGLVGRSPPQRINAMTDIALKAQEDLLSFDVSDDALEIAASAARRELYPWFLHGLV
jgi:hypothetical protein